MPRGLAFIAGLAIGAVVRLCWPEHPAAGPVSAPAAPASNVADRQSGAQSHGTQFPSRRSDLEAILRKAGMFPESTDPDKGISWLFVSPREDALLKSPEYVEASITATEESVDRQCAVLFRKLGLEPGAEDKLRRTLAEMVFARHEISELAQVQNRTGPPPQVQAMLTESDADYREQIRAQLGATAFASFENYFDATPEREELAGAFLRVSALARPLTADQRDALATARRAAKSDGANAVNLETELSPAQLQVYAEWQSEDRALGILREIVPNLRDSVTPPPLYSRAAGTALAPP